MRAHLTPTWGPRAKPRHYRHRWRVCPPQGGGVDVVPCGEVLRRRRTSGGGDWRGREPEAQSEAVRATQEGGLVPSQPGRAGSRADPPCKRPPDRQNFYAFCLLTCSNFSYPKITPDPKTPHPHLQGEAPHRPPLPSLSPGCFSGSLLWVRASPLPPLGSGHFREASGSSRDPGARAQRARHPAFGASAAVGLAPCLGPRLAGAARVRWHHWQAEQAAAPTPAQHGAPPRPSRGRATGSSSVWRGRGLSPAAAAGRPDSYQMALETGLSRPRAPGPGGHADPLLLPLQSPHPLGREHLLPGDVLQVGPAPPCTACGRD